MPPEKAELLAEINRQHGEELDAFFATTGGGEPLQVQIDYYMQQLELVLWGKLGNTWEVNQLKRVEALVRNMLSLKSVSPAQPADQK